MMIPTLRLLPTIIGNQYRQRLLLSQTCITTDEKTNQILVDTLTSDMKSALRLKESTRLNVIRGLLSDIHYAKKSVKGPPKQYATLVQNAIERRQESLRLFQVANRMDLVDKEKVEIEVLQKYL